jgi:hypothetical protein
MKIAAGHPATKLSLKLSLVAAFVPIVLQADAVVVGPGAIPQWLWGALIAAGVGLLIWFLTLRSQKRALEIAIAQPGGVATVHE